MSRYLWMLLVFFTWGSANFMMKLVGLNEATANGNAPVSLSFLYNDVTSASGALAIVIGYMIAGSTVGLLGGGKLGFTRWYWFAAAVGACYITGNWAFLRLTESVEISVLAPIISLSVAIPVVLGVVALREPITLRKGAGIALAFLAAFLLAGRS